MTKQKKTKLKKLEIYLREIAFDEVVYGCPECSRQISLDDAYCSGCGIEFEEEL